jgi:hypothetical protein
MMEVKWNSLRIVPIGRILIIQAFNFRSSTSVLVKPNVENRKCNNECFSIY